MTTSEALQEIRKQVHRKTDNCDMTISKDCYKKVVSALEKQIPKKVVPYNCGQFRCECGEIVKSYEKYCPECGQALDWSDT